MTLPDQRRGRDGFTLVEAIVAAAIASIVLTALMLGSINLLRTHKAVEAYSDSAIDQARVLDYIARDVRRATSVTVLQNPTRLSLTIPDQYLTTNPTDRRFSTPTVGTSVVYGSGSINVTFYVSGKNFIRQENGVNSTIATNILNFTPVLDASDPNAKLVKTTVAFTPIFRSNPATASSAATSMTNCVFLRNK